MAEFENAINIHQKKCSNCNISRLCGLCFSQMVSGDKLVLNENYCIERREQVREMLTEYTEIMERSPDNFDSFISGYFDEMHNITGNIVD